MSACESWHAADDEVVRCELVAGHPPPHKAEVRPHGVRMPRLVTWVHDGGRQTAEAATVAWTRLRAAGVL
jgi:hypothetical protein